MTIEQAYEAWKLGEKNDSELLNHLMKHHNLLKNEMFIELWLDLWTKESNAASRD